MHLFTWDKLGVALLYQNGHSFQYFGFSVNVAVKEPKRGSASGRQRFVPLRAISDRSFRRTASTMLAALNARLTH